MIIGYIFYICSGIFCLCKRSLNIFFTMAFLSWLNVNVNGEMLEGKHHALFSNKIIHQYQKQFHLTREKLIRIKTIDKMPNKV